jgi:hypothetical protein
MPCKHVHAIHSLFQAIDQAEDDEEEVNVLSLPEPEPAELEQVEILLPAELEQVETLLPAELEQVETLLPAELEQVEAEPESSTVLVDKRTTIMHQLEVISSHSSIF